MDSFYDPAFGPVGALGLAFDANVEQAQRYLNALGFGPIKVDGLFGPKTQAALQGYYATRGQSAPGSIDANVVAVLKAAAATAAGAQPFTPVSIAPGGSTAATYSGAAAPPVKALPWVTPTMLAVGIGAAAVIGYLVWRSKTGGGLFGDSEDEREEREERRRCGRFPTTDFVEGEVLRPVEE